MTRRGRSGAAILLACLAFGHPCPAAAGEDDVAALKSAIADLRAQNRALADRLAALEAASATKRPATRPVPAREARPPAQAPAPSKVARAAAAPGPASPPPPEASRGAGLEQRVKELEIGKTAQEDAIRGILQDSFSKLGSKVNEFVTLGGALETSAGYTKDFSGRSRNQVSLDTAELDLEIRANDWMVGNLTLSYSSGTDVLFPTTNGFTAGVDRLTVDKGTVTIGDTQRFPLFVKAGLDVLSFGTSTGFQRLDTLAITGPLSNEVFETRRVSAGIGFEFPTPPPTRPTPPQIVPTVRPLVLNPAIDYLARALGYAPPPIRPRPPTPFSFSPQPPPFYGTIALYDASSVEGIDRRVTDNINATLGYRTGGSCGRPYHELRDSHFCPWSIDVSVDYVSSIFDSRFLEQEYRAFLGQIGSVPGVAASAKATFGPMSLIAEWNGAVRRANFVDGLGQQVGISPSAWQVSLGYQFDWNPWVEAIGAQGTFLALGYSGTHDLAGVTSADGSRVGFVPQHRLTLTGAEWVLEGAKVAVEYSHNWDYAKSRGGTGRQADGVFTRLTYVW